MEDEVYPDVNDYIPQYLNDRFRHPEVSLDHFSFYDVYAYGSAIYWKYITERITGPAFIKQIWTQLKNSCINPSAYTWCSEGVTEIPLIKDILLNNYQKDIQTVFKDYANAIYVKDFKDGTLSIFPKVTTINSNIDQTLQISGTLDHLASKYYLIKPSNTTTTQNMAVQINGDSSTTWKAAIISEDTNGATSVKEISLQPNVGAETITGFGTTYATAVVVISNVDSSADRKAFTINASVTPSCASSYTSELYQASCNLISLPAVPSGTNAVQALNIQSNSLYAYITTANTLVSDAESQFPGISESGRGYWLCLSAPQSINMIGCPNTKDLTTVTLEAGWNIFGNPYESDISWSDSKISIKTEESQNYQPMSFGEDAGWLSAIIYEYDGSKYIPRTINNGYNLQPWKGYWIKSNKRLSMRIFQ